MSNQYFSGIDYFRTPNKCWTSAVQTIPVENCLRCGNALQMKEMNAQQAYCTPCKRLVEAAAHNEKVWADLHSANRKGGL